ncbi:arginine deiminase family protein [Agrobacterium leguminum]|uniref:arginine deiminase n=1 Tax=Agrobacterium deltaense NCPPB 1641 TaxID=1183425 RepID=A0A1S7TRW0_9HYPH|nr:MULTISPECIES: arginine deiminase family protein [Agrobacterium]WFS69311.1 arginine deiminase family protein [Agrobacterium leguminum]CVI57339.1 putative Amidinotransferase [Agrobacterium deltaense NCPPB 1641]
MGIVDSAHGGAGWCARADGRATNQSPLAVKHDGDDLSAVLLHLPDMELNRVTDPSSVDWVAKMQIERARSEILLLAELYRKHDVSVYFFEPVRPMANHVFMRDLFTMTPQGALISRMASEKRAGEEVEVTAMLASMGIPIVKSVGGSGVFEGPDIVFFDDGHAFVAEGIRSNSLGAEQVTQELVSQGIEVTNIQTTYGCGHLDGVVSILNRKTAVLFPRRVSYVIYEKLRRHGYNLVIIDDEQEADISMAINAVCLNQETVLMNERAVSLRKQVEACGVNVVTINLDETMKGGGAMHCATGVLGRKSNL